MRELHARLARVPIQAKSVRSSIRFSCGKGSLRESITRIGRNYGLCDERGKPSDSEIIRVLLVTAITGGQPNRVQTAVEILVRLQKPMLAASLGRKLMSRYATGDVAVRGGMVGFGRKRTGNLGKNKAKVVLGKWLTEALQGFALYFQDDQGVVRDGAMMAELCGRAIGDADLHAIMSGYVQRTARLRERLAQAEAWIVQVVDEAMQDEPVRRAG